MALDANGALQLTFADFSRKSAPGALGSVM